MSIRRPDLATLLTERGVPAGVLAEARNQADKVGMELLEACQRSERLDAPRLIHKHTVAALHEHQSAAVPGRVREVRTDP